MVDDSKQNNKQVQRRWTNKKTRTGVGINDNGDIRMKKGYNSPDGWFLGGKTFNLIKELAAYFSKGEITIKEFTGVAADLDYHTKDTKESFERLAHEIFKYKGNMDKGNMDKGNMAR